MREDWIQTWSGISFFPMEPREEDIEIQDIAHSLSQQCRFSGHTRKFYSVAEHSIRVSLLLPNQIALAGLLHDASEAYLVDIPSPLKRLPAFAAYREAETKLQNLIYKRFGIVNAYHDVIKEADIRVLKTEARDLMSTPKLAWVSKDVEPVLSKINPMSSQEACDRFLDMFWRLIRKE